MAGRGAVGALLVGGASRRFGSPKALAALDGQTLAERAHATLAGVFDHVLVVGKAADRIRLPWAILDDGSDVRAAMVGVAAALRAAEAPAVVVLPTDMPFVTGDTLRKLEEEVRGGALAARVGTGPLPAALRVEALAVLERRIAAGDLALRNAFEELGARVVEADRATLVNVNTPDDLVRVERTTRR